MNTKTDSRMIAASQVSTPLLTYSPPPVILKQTYACQHIRQQHATPARHGRLFPVPWRLSPEPIGGDVAPVVYDGRASYGNKIDVFSATHAQNQFLCRV